VVAVGHVTDTLQAGYGDAFTRTTQTTQLNTLERKGQEAHVCNVNLLALLLVGYEANAGMKSALAD
jgi:hypothetical protein